MKIHGQRLLGGLMYRAAVISRGEISVYAHLSLLREQEQLSSTEVIRLQRRRLATVLRERMPAIPHYSRWSELCAGVTTENAEIILRRLPVLEKGTLQQKREGLCVRGWKGRAYSKTTGGSTGAPVTVRKDARAIAHEMAATWQGYGWFGVAIGDPCVRFWGQPTGNFRRKLRYAAADMAMNRITLSAFGYDHKSLSDYAARIRHFRPRYLYGYVSVLEDLGRHLLENGDSLSDLSLKSVVTTSEVLSGPQREVIAEAFAAPVQNEYGCGEVGPIAYECPAGSLHLIPTNHYVEVLDESGEPARSGEPGAVVITDLTNRIMPLIRYRVGDTASFGEPCSCGRSTPVLDNVFGREYDFVESRSGKRFHGEFFMYLFEDLRKRFPAIGQFKVIQTDPSSLTVQLVMSSGPEAETIAGVEEEFRRRCPDFKLDLERCAVIPRQASGKMRVVENRIAQRRTGAASNSVLP